MISGQPADRPTVRSTPTAFQLHAAVLAAVLAARVLDEGGNTAEALLLSYEKVVTGGLYRTQDLRGGNLLLQRARLVRIEMEGRYTPTPALLNLRDLPDDVAAEILLHELLLHEPPLWLYAAVGNDEVRWENVPDADQDSLRQLLADAARREALLLTLGHTVDSARLAEIGAAGEEYVVAACRHYLQEQGRPDLAAQVRRVSQRSDQLGYDVTSPDTAGRRHRLEVKTTSAGGGRVEFFLSRNEATVGQRDASWSLVAVRCDRDDALHLIGWCGGFAIVPLLPHDATVDDATGDGRWANVRVSLPAEAFTAGLPLDRP
jgi:Protein NO VEIN, C-terminal